MFVKSLAPVVGFICAAVAIVPVAEAGCGHRHGGGGYSSYQSRPSGAYAAQMRAERKAAAARAAAARRAKIAAVRAAKARVAKADAAAEKAKETVTTAAAPEPAKTETGSIAKTNDKVDVAAAPTTCSKFVAAVGATVPVACDQK